MSSLLNTVDPEKAEGKVAALYDQMMQGFGMVPNAMQLHSVSPVLLERQLSYIGYFMEHSTMSPILQTLIRLLVSSDTGCDYCITLNTGLLLREGMTMDEISAIRQDPSSAPLDAKEKALLLHVLKAASAPKTVTAEDVAMLRDLGYPDQDIFEAVHYGANMVMVDILFESFRVENEQM